MLFFPRFNVIFIKTKCSLSCFLNEIPAFKNSDQYFFTFLKFKSKNHFFKCICKAFLRHLARMRLLVTI